MEHKHKIWTGTILLVFGLIILFLTSTNNFTGNASKIKLTGTLKFTVNPAEGVEVYLDNILKNNTIGSNNGFFELSDIKKGNHKLLLKKFGYLNYRKTLNIKQSQTTNLGVINLIPVRQLIVNPSQRSSQQSQGVLTGNLNIDIKVNNIFGINPLYSATAVLDDSESITALNSLYSISFNNIPYGSHQLLIKKDGYKDYTTTLDINSPIKFIEVFMTPLLIGNIQVNSNPDGADVYLAGRMVGTTPLNILDIPIGRYPINIIRIRETDQTSINQTINANVLNGQTANVDVVFI